MVGLEDGALVSQDDLNLCFDLILLSPVPCAGILGVHHHWDSLVIFLLKTRHCWVQDIFVFFVNILELLSCTH